MTLKQIEHKTMELLHIAEIRERNGKRKMSDDEKAQLRYLESKYYK